MEDTLITRQAVTDEKISELTREVRLHNNFAQRVPVLEEQIKILDKLNGNFSLYESVNHIHTNNELSPILKLNYMQSNKILHYKQNERISALEELIKS